MKLTKRLVCIAAALAFLTLGLALANANAATSNASITATIVDNDKLEVIGHGFPAAASIQVTIKTGTASTPVIATSETDGRFGVLSYLPQNYSGSINVSATGGGANATTTTATNGGTGAPIAASPSPLPPAPAPSESPAPAPAPGKVLPSQCKQTAAQTFNWGAPTYQTGFDGTTLDPTWHAYGPESGHGGEGTRTPAAITEGGGTVKISSDGNGTTGAMKWFPGQKYGRWEVCMKVETGGQHYVAILWPDAEDFDGGGGEIDFVEEGGGTGHQEFFLHCGLDEPNCKNGGVDHDASQWTAWAVEWTPEAITAYVDGKEWFKTTDASEFPPRSMNLCLQLDPGDGGADAMVIDDAKQWAIPQSEPGTLGLKPGENSTGHPEENPDRKPRPLTTAEMLGK